MPLDPVAAAAVRSLGAEITALNRRLAQLEGGSRLAGLKYSSIDGGALVVNDAAGTTRQVIGAQPDGTVTTVELGASPPAAPSVPLVAAQIGGLLVGWDGLLGGAGPLSDFLWVEVHVSATSGFTPDSTTLKRTMQAGGVVTVAGLTPGTTYYAVLVGVNRSRTSSPPSAQSSAVPLTTTQTIPAGSITPGLLSFSAGGQTVSIGASAPPSPAANDLWFDTGNGGRLNQWSGSAWTPYQFGTGALAANSITAALIVGHTITAAQIAAGTITATEIQAGTIDVAQLKAGILVAGIVNGTVVTGATLQNSSANPRTSINPDGTISITNAAGIVLFRVGNDGTLLWYDTAGNLLMQLSPGGTQEIYASLTGPVRSDQEPPSPPNLLVSATSAVSSATYANTLTSAVPAGSAVTVVASAFSTTAATGVTDSQGNTYTLVQSSTTGQYQQVFQAVNVAALGVTDSITVTYAAANTQQKNILAVATSFVPAVTPLDFSAQATGTGTAISVAGTPTAYGDALLFIASWANLGAPATAPDGWQPAADQIHATSGQWTGMWYSVNLAPSGSVTASATITSAAWAGVLLGYKASPAQPLTMAPTPTAATTGASTAWADDGVFSCKVTKVGTATSWGITFPPFPVQPNSSVAARIVIGTLNVALGAVETGITFWTGPNGTGTNLGSWFVTWGALGFNAFFPLTIYNCIAGPTAQSATFYVMERQADTAGNWFLVDHLSVPGGLAYSNSPNATMDALANPVPQGINFVGLPQLTNVLGVADPYLGTQIANIDGQGNISGQQLNAAADVGVRGQSLLNDILPNYSQGIVSRGWVSTGGNWPATPISAEVALLELDFLVPAGREYLLQVLPCNFIPTISADTQMIHRLKYTTDGSTPTTSSGQVANHSPTITTVQATSTGKNYPSPYQEFVLPVPVVDTTYRVLLTGNIQAGTYVYVLSSTVLEMRVTDMGNNAPVNNGVVLGTGGSGGTGAQTVTEHFYANQTWTYNEYGLRNSNGTMYQGAYSGEGFAQHCWMQWSGGDKGNSLNTVLNYTVNKVSLRTLCQHTWYNSGMTVSLHSSSGSVGNLGALSAELGAYTAKAGQYQEVILGSAQWSPFKAGGTTRLVFRPPSGSTALGYYGYFWGGGNNNANVPRLTVTYTH